MRITEIYASIQGESQYAGRPSVLVRTTGCDLRCSYCDTTYAFHGGHDMTVSEVVAQVKSFGLPFVLLTGGEPMLQHGIAELAQRLLAEGLEVAIETSGAHALDSLPQAVYRIVDIKTPSSGESTRMDASIYGKLRPCDAVKFVIADEADYNFSAEKVVQLGLAGRSEILFSPAHGRLDPRVLIQWVIRDRMPVRVNLQFHKYVWGAEVRGV